MSERQTILLKLISNKYVCLGFIAIIFYLRNYHRFPDGALFAEDGIIFLSQVRDVGIHSLLIPYAGYTHLVIRIIAYIVNFFPLQYTPELYHLASYLIVIYVACIIVNSKISHLDQFHKNLLAICIIATSYQNYEIYLILTNIQWFTAFILVAHIIEEYDGKTRLMPAINTAIFGLQGPFIIFLTPFILIKLFKKWKRADYFLLSISACVTSIIQIIFILDVHRVPHLISSSLILKDIRNLFHGYLGILSVVFVPVIVYQFIIILREKDFFKYYSIIVTFYFGIIMAILSMFVIGKFLGAGSRYFFIPHVMFNWTLLLITEIKTTSRNIKALAWFLFILTFVGVFRHFTVPANENYNWKSEVSELKQLGIKEFVVAPGDSVWRFTLRCKN